MLKKFIAFLNYHKSKFIIGFTLIFLLTLTITFLLGDEDGKGSIQEVAKTLTKDNRNKACVSNTNPIFTHYFTDLSKIEMLGPLGGVIGGSPGRSYVTIKEGKVPVYAPVDAILETIVYARRGGAGTAGEYGLYFQVSCEVTFLLDHIDEVTEEIKVLSPSEPEQTSATQMGTKPNKKIVAGTLLGFSDGTPLARTFDFLVKNSSKKAFHIKPSRWTWDQTTDAVCPYDFYKEEQKKTYYALLRERSADGGWVLVSECGSPSKDVAGTISGGWFQGESTNSQGKWLAVGQMFNWSEVALREDGNIKLSLKDYSSKPKPNEVKVGQSVCYQGYANNWAWFKLVSETQLKTALGAGSCPDSFPNESSETWER